MQQPEPPSALTALWHFRRMSAAIIGGFVVLGVLFTIAFPPASKATATVLLTDPRAGLLLGQTGTSTSDLVRNTADQAELIESTLVLQLASDRLDPPMAVATLRERVTAVPAEDANVVRVTAEAASDIRAIEIANVVVDAFRDVRQQDSDQRLAAVLAEISAARAALPAPPAEDTRAQDAYLQSVVALNESETQARLSAALYNDGVEAIDPADEAVGGQLPVLVRNVALAVIAGALLALLVAWRRAEEHRRIEEPEELQTLVGVPLLGTSAWQRRRKPGFGDVRDEAHEAIVARLRLVFTDGVVMVTGSDAEAVGLLSLRIAVGIADEGRGCVLVDADTHAAHASLWAERLATLVLPAERLEPSPAPPELLPAGATGQPAPPLAPRSERPPDPHVDDVPVTVRTLMVEATRVPLVTLRDGDREAAAKLRSHATQQVIANLRRSSSFVVLSAPGLPDEPEAISAVRLADGVVLAVNAGAPVAKVRDLERRVREMPSPLLGVVLITGRPNAGDLVT